MKYSDLLLDKLPSPSSDLLSMTGRACAVIGTANSVGALCARVLANAGASVLLGDRQVEHLERELEEIGAKGGEARSCSVDVRERESVRSFLDFGLEEFGRIDAVVNAAGVGEAAESMRTPIVELDEKTVVDLVRMHTLGALWGTQLAVRLMSDQGRGGSIINFSSAIVDKPTAGTAAYAMSKATVEALTRVAALEAGRARIRVNAVEPGLLLQPTTGAVVGDSARQSLLGRGRGDEVAYTVLFLASDASELVTGQTLRPNGGASLI